MLNTKAEAATRPAQRTSIPMADLQTCIHCGLCTSACPTYLELGSELDSPRGRIHLMRAVTEGRIGWSDDVVAHLDLCLECRACETACPSGVKYAQLLEAARADIERQYRRPLRERLILGLLRDRILPYPGRLKWALAPVRLLGPLARSLARLLPNDARRMVEILPQAAPAGPYQLPEVVPAVGERKYRVALLTGCVAQVLFARTNWATARVLARAGCEVVIPKEQGCCGALHLHSGAPQTTQALARKNLRAFDLDGVDAIITNAAGCGSTLKEYGHVLASDSEYARQAERFSEKAQDISVFLDKIGLPPFTRSVPLKVAYHDACHLAHGQGVRAEPRRLLAQIPGLELVELRESEVCCGSAGLYNILQPEMAERLLERKMQAIADTGAQVVATGNPGCLMQIAKGLRDRGSAVEVVHPIELLARAYGEL